MGWLEAIIMGIIQGLTEFLPVSSSGHLEIGSAILGIQAGDNLLFAVFVHAATALSTIVVFRKDIADIFKGLLAFQWNEATEYAFKIGLSMIPVLIVGLFFKDTVEGFFTSNLLLVGSMLIITASLLLFTHFKKQNEGSVSWLGSFIIGLAQAFAILPGISRSGATIATGLLLGFDKSKVTRFSFLMVLVPILGASLLELKDYLESPSDSHQISAVALALGFISAFVAGFIACKWMINIVRKGKLTYFAIYCFIAGSIAIIYSLL